jgi:RNAse (barnase) inhibitor barstar
VARVPLSVIRLDARGWHDRDDLWRDLLAGLGAPGWHGANLDALYDGLVAGENSVRPPLAVEIAGAARLPAALVAYLTRIRAVFDDAARDGAAVALRFVAPLSAAAR